VPIWGKREKKNVGGLLRLARIEKLLQYERVAGLQRLEAGLQAGPGIVAAGGDVVVDALGFDAGLEHHIALRGERLAAIALGHPDVADEHGRGATRERWLPGCDLALIVATGFLLVPGLLTPMLGQHKDRPFSW